MHLMFTQMWLTAKKWKLFINESIFQSITTIVSNCFDNLLVLSVICQSKIFFFLNDILWFQLLS